jgi:hypothetical protein
MDYVLISVAEADVVLSGVVAIVGSSPWLLRSSLWASLRVINVGDT